MTTRNLKGLALAALAVLAVGWGCRPKKDTMSSIPRPVSTSPTASKSPPETATFALG